MSDFFQQIIHIATKQRKQICMNNNWKNGNETKVEESFCATSELGVCIRKMYRRIEEQKEY